MPAPRKSLFEKLNPRRSRTGDAPRSTTVPFLSAAAVILSGAILVSSCTLCYAVEVQGQRVTYFRDQSTYTEAVTLAEDRTSQILNTDYTFPEDVTVKATLAPKSQVEDAPQAANSLMNAIPELEHVYTLWVDGVMVGAAQTDTEITQAMNLVKEHYRTPTTLSLTVDSQVNVRYEYIAAENGTLSARDLAARLLEEVPQTFDYTVPEGETLEGLLARFDMTQERLQELNPDIDLTPGAVGAGLEMFGEEGVSQEELSEMAALWAAEYGTPLTPGLELVVEQVCPRLVVSTVEEQTLSRPTAPAVIREADPTMFTGEQRVIQEGAAAQEAVLARVVKRAGVTVASTDLSAVRTQEGTPLIIGVGTQPMPQLPEGCLFLWPVQGPITSDYGYRFIFGETNYHQGVDIAAPEATAINAAAAGTVIFAGERGTYGNLVVVSHGNGFQTYYAHCSKLLVQAGDQVSQGQPVAAVGSTGRSTGPHLHFEVRYQGSPIDPLLYLPGENNAPARTEIPLDQEETAEEAPDLPQEPVTPGTPEVPAEPESPAQPEVPALPDDPENPAQPAAPAQPDTPGPDGLPAAPDPAKTPDPQDLAEDAL